MRQDRLTKSWAPKLDAKAGLGIRPKKVIKYCCASIVWFTLNLPVQANIWQLVLNLLCYTSGRKYWMSDNQSVQYESAFCANCTAALCFRINSFRPAMIIYCILSDIRWEWHWYIVKVSSLYQINLSALLDLQHELQLQTFTVRAVISEFIRCLNIFPGRNSHTLRDELCIPDSFCHFYAHVSFRVGVVLSVGTLPPFSEGGKL